MDMFQDNGLSAPDRLDPDLHLRDDLNMDSLMLAELTVRVESEFSVDIFEDGLVETIGDVVKKIEGHQQS
ncbi:acyl carrier protein [Halobacillus litoralis]|uniref:Acyl carrier protein n=2 Tax=Bacillaceae TaxID=186817 RepID=A0A845DYW8_9BACI|nr:phosphopantetheine-binding protein [Halobacillus litoralis]MYL21512.1 acyl carrier protein [Halobacillus litoralis]MYL30033.1 acyl carrier protein [Halobacillus halophilus]MYL37504.1 acyl carrier protein [Halobacillus litoralis]